MELFTKLGQEWEKMKRDMEELKKENQVLAKKVSGMSKDQEKAMRDLRKENRQLLDKMDSMEEELTETKQKVSGMSKDQEKAMRDLRKENRQLLDKMDSMEEELTETKQKVSGMSKDKEKAMRDLRRENRQLLDKMDSMEEDLTATREQLRSEMNKSKDFRRMVASLKRVWNRALVSAHHPRPQMPALPTPPTPSSDGNATTLTSSPASVRSSPPGACAPTPSVKHPPKAKQLTKMERKHLKDTSKFHVLMSGRRSIQPGQRIKVDGYDRVSVDSVYMNVGSGVYRTPLNGRYRFGVRVLVWGGGGAYMYVCGGDGRREKVASRVVRGVRWVDYDVVWDCPEGLTVWLEVEECTGCRDTEFIVGFRGGLVD